jgi:hypothetical protein
VWLAVSENMRNSHWSATHTLVIRKCWLEPPPPPLLDLGPHHRDHTLFATPARVIPALFGSETTGRGMTSPCLMIMHSVVQCLNPCAGRQATEMQGVSDCLWCDSVADPFERELVARFTGRWLPVFGHMSVRLSHLALRHVCRVCTFFIRLRGMLRGETQT